MKRYFRSKSRIIGSLGQPVLYLVALGYGLGPAFRGTGKVDYLHYLVPGVISQSILFTSIFSGIEVIWDKQFGFLKETLVAPVPRITVMLGRTLGGATVATFQGCIVFVLATIMGFRPENWASVPLILVVMFLMALLFTSLGTGLASIVDDMQGFQLIMNFLIMPLFFLSGALFPLDSAPKWLQAVAACDPLSYGADALRVILLGVGHFGLLVDFSFLVIATIALLAIGSRLFSRMQV